MVPVYCKHAIMMVYQLAGIHRSGNSGASRSPTNQRILTNLATDQPTSWSSPSPFRSRRRLRLLDARRMALLSRFSRISFMVLRRLPSLRGATVVDSLVAMGILWLSMDIHGNHHIAIHGYPMISYVGPSVNHKVSWVSKWVSAVYLRV